MPRSLLRSTSLFSANTFLSRVLGFIRDVVFAHYFGALGGFDAFIIAFKIPNFMRRVFAEGAFSQAFVPVLSQYREQRSHEDIRQFISHISGGLVFILLLVTLIGIVAAPIIISIFAPGFLHHNGRFDLAVGMLRITFPYIFLISLAALCGAILNSYDSFGVPAFTPVLLNMTLIFMAIVVAPLFNIPIYALATGVFIAGIIQLLFLLPFVYHKHLLPLPRINFKDSGVCRVLKLMVPAIFGVSAVQLGILIDTIFASFLKPGSISWLYYSDRLMNFPLGVFGVAIATVVLPKLSRHHSGRQTENYSKTLDWALRLLLLIGIPFTIGLFIMAGPLMSTLFQNGKFSAYDVVMARQSLMAFAVGIQAFMLIKVLASGFYATQDIKTPVKIACVAVLVNVVFNFIFIFPLKHAGLALATSLAAFVNAGLLFMVLVRRKVYKPQFGWMKFAIQLIFANAAMALFLIFLSGHLSDWIQSDISWRVVHLLFLACGSFVIYFSCLLMSGLRIRHFEVR